MPLFVTIDRNGKIATGIIADDLEAAQSLIGVNAMEAPSYAVPESPWRYDKEKNEFVYETPEWQKEKVTE